MILQVLLMIKNISLKFKEILYCITIKLTILHKIIVKNVNKKIILILQRWKYCIERVNALNKMYTIKNECIKEKVKIILTVKKLIKSRLIWFNHICRMPIEVTV